MSTISNATSATSAALSSSSSEASSYIPVRTSKSKSHRFSPFESNKTKQVTTATQSAFISISTSSSSISPQTFSPTPITVMTSPSDAKPDEEATDLATLLSDTPVFFNPPPAPILTSRPLSTSAEVSPISPNLSSTTSPSPSKMEFLKNIAK